MKEGRCHRETVGFIKLLTCILPPQVQLHRIVLGHNLFPPTLIRDRTRDYTLFSTVNEKRKLSIVALFASSTGYSR